MKLPFIFCTVLALFSAFYTNAQTNFSVSYHVAIDDADFWPYLPEGQGQMTSAGGGILITFKNLGDDLENFAIEATWPKGTTVNPYVASGFAFAKENVDATTIRFKASTWVGKFTTGATSVLQTRLPWNDFIEFYPKNFKLVDLATGTKYDMVEDIIGGDALMCRDAAPEPFKTDKKIVAYMPNFDIPNAKKALEKYIDMIDQVRFEWYGLSDKGTLQAAEGHGLTTPPPIDYWVMNDMIELCKRHGVEIVPVLNNYNATKDDFDADRMSNMLNNPSIQANHINEIIKLLTDHPEFAGIDIDYENMKATVKDAYSTFVEKLAIAVQTKGKILTTALATKVGPGTWDAPQAQDYKRIGNAVDEMLLMTYDLHWSTSKKPGPVSAADWANDVITYAVTQVKDPSKIQMGIPLYGYDWVVNSKGTGVTSNDVQNLIALYHPTINTEPDGGEKYFTYTVGGATHTVYYQEASSITKKLEAFDEYNMGAYIGGVGVWRLGSEDPSLWLALCKKLKPNNGKCALSGVDPIIKPVTSFNTRPNPFTDISSVNFTLSYDADVTLTVYNMLGASVLDIVKGTMAKGQHSITLDLKDVPAGIYLCKLSTGRENSVIKMIKQ